MHILVIEATGLAGSFTKSVPINDQAANDPARRGNIIREHTPAGGKVNSWRVMDGDRILAQSAMKSALTQSNPGIADSKAEIKLTQGDADYVSALTGAPLQEVEVEEVLIDPNTGSPSGIAFGWDGKPLDEDDPFDLSPKAEAEVQEVIEDRMEKKAIDLADVPIYNPGPSAGQVHIADGLERRKAALAEAREHGRKDAYDLFAGDWTVKSVLSGLKTPYGDGGDGRDTGLADAYAAGLTEVANDFKPIVWKTPEDHWNYDGKGSDGKRLTAVEIEYHRDRLSNEYGVDLWVVTDAPGRHHLMRAMKVGEWVSEAFNGDYYPLGRIKRLGGAGNDCLGYRMITVETHGEDVIFWRRKQTDVWKKGGADGTFGLVGGIYNRRNPSF